MSSDTLIFGGALLGVLLLSAPACYIAECITKRLSALFALILPPEGEDYEGF